MMKKSIAVFALALACACARKTETGNARLRVSAPRSLTAASVTKVTVQLSGPELTPITVDLGKDVTGWSGLFTGIRAGPNRAFHAEAFDSSGKKLFTGDAATTTISAGLTAIVAILLTPVDPTPDFTQPQPIIDSVVLSSNDVDLGATIGITATAHDADPAQTLRFAWTATAGSFAPANALNTIWTAPGTPATPSLTLTVTDGAGQSASISIGVTVESLPGSGNAQVNITFQESPVINSMTAVPAVLVPGQPTTVAVGAVDPQGLTLSYAWSASCAGSFDSTNGAAATFTAPASTPDTVCTLTVVVQNPAGGSARGKLQLAVQPLTSPEVEPQFDFRYQSLTTVVGHQSVGLQVLAHSPQSRPLSFAWSASSGTLGTPTTTATGSAIAWDVNASCGGRDSAVLTVSDNNGGAVSATFAITEICPLSVFDVGTFDSTLFNG